MIIIIVIQKKKIVLKVKFGCLKCITFLMC